MKLEVKGQKSKVKSQFCKLKVIFFTFHFLLLTSLSFAQNDLQKIPTGGFIEKWLISNEFPAEIDAGMWENFNRFNIETLPQKDWLKPFPKPNAGSFKSAIQTQEKPKSVDSNGNPLPEIGAALALGLMLERTRLRARQDEKTKAISIIAKAPSQAPPAPAH